MTIKLLANAERSNKVSLTVADASATSQAKLEAAGGKLTLAEAK